MPNSLKITPSPTSGKVLFLFVLLFSTFTNSMATENANDSAEGLDSVEVLVTLRGEMMQGGMIVGKTLAESQVWLNGKALRVSDQGDFVFGFGRDAKLDHRLRVQTLAGDVWKKHIKLKPRKYDIQRIEGIKKRIMNPNQDDLKRIRKDTAEVKAARKADEDRLDFLQTFDWPVQGRITGVYGSQRVYNGVPKRPHFGIDIAAPLGTPVNSPVGGVVTLAHPDMFYSGGTLIVDHGFGISSTFLHLDKVLVKVGDEVSRGDLLGEVGSSGRSTGPHLDWRMNWFDHRLDPSLIAEGKPLVLK